MGSGKTTLAKWFSSAWGIPHIEIDHLRSRDDLIHHVTCAVPSGWVAEANRDGWRSNGMSDDESCPSDSCLRCISPAEVKLLCTNVIPKWTPSK